jgi:hypothetical protein
MGFGDPLIRPVPANLRKFNDKIISPEDDLYGGHHEIQTR